MRAKVGLRFRECLGCNFLQVLPEKIPYHEGHRLRFCRPSVREELKPELMPPLAPEVYLMARESRCELRHKTKSVHRSDLECCFRARYGYRAPWMHRLM